MPRQTISYNEIFVVFLGYIISTLYAIVEHLELYELFFVYVFSLLVFIAVRFLVVFLRSPIFGILILLSGGVCTLAILFAVSVVTVMIFMNPVDVRSVYTLTIIELISPIILGVIIKVKPLVSEIFVKNKNKVTFTELISLLILPWVLVFFMILILISAILLRDINYLLAVVAFMTLTTLLEIFSIVVWKRNMLPLIKRVDIHVSKRL